MLQVEEDRLPEAQTQNPAPIPAQEQIPGGVHEDIVLSFDRRRGWMRINLDGSEWWFKQLLGACQILSCDNAKGRLHLRGQARINGETLQLYRDPASGRHPLIEGERLEKTYNRLCYRRYEPDGSRATIGNWRLRDERKTREIYKKTQGTEQERWMAAMSHPDTLKLVEGIVGDLRVEWPEEDIVAHIFSHGFAVLEPDTRIAHLYDLEI